MCEFNNIDFDADKSVQYKHVRKELAKKFNDDFGVICTYFYTTQVSLSDMDETTRKEFQNKLKLENESIDRGYKAWSPLWR